ncbi:MAG: hypothetical protein JW838_00630 [Spirochaetes bacterium]|nr:hypothetical protein [Spirochaetota bacterium]
MADQAWARPCFNMACACALLGSTDTAIGYLRLALERDALMVLPWIRSDSDLDAVRSSGAYRVLEKEYAMDQLIAENARFLYD